MFARVVKAGLVTMDPATGAVQRVIALQYNPETLTRTLAPQAAGTDPAQALRLKGVAVETLRLEAAIDATDQLAEPDSHPAHVELGIHPDIAALQALINPTVQVLNENQQLAATGVFEVLPAEAPLCLFVWSKERVVPVRVTEMTIAEEAFDIQLNPIRAKVTLAMRVLSVDDLGMAHRGGTIHLAHLANQELMAKRATSAAIGALGLAAL
ncbi:hypothetical protein GCM10027020_06030 [Nocardioides salsibiostraticola]